MIRLKRSAVLLRRFLRRAGQRLWLIRGLCPLIWLVMQFYLGETLRAIAPRERLILATRKERP